MIIAETIRDIWKGIVDSGGLVLIAGAAGVFLAAAGFWLQEWRTSRRRR